ncbi:MAG: hypothetical protein MUO53_16045 [Maribacter sp.]|nr:hypothetical protein [Maribacter sp.]
MKLKKFIKECRDQEVFKNLSIYIVSSWVLIQVFSVIAEPVGFSKTIISYVLIILLLGFPLYIYLFWKFQLSKSVVEVPAPDTPAVTKKGKFAQRPFQKLYFTSLTFIAIASVSLALVVAKNVFFQSTDLKEIKTSDKIAVINFDNNTGDTKYDMAGKMAVDWIIHGITENKVGQVISPKIIDEYTQVLKSSVLPAAAIDNARVVTDYLKPSKIITGEYYLNKNRLLFQCSIKDAQMDKTLISFKPVECDPGAPLDCIEALKQRILGYLVTEKNKLLNLQESPPKYAAYQYLIEAKAFLDNNDEEHLRLLDKAIETDSTFFEPHTYKLLYYYNTGQYAIADSLQHKMAMLVGNNQRQRNLLELYEALLNGNNKNVYLHLKKEYAVVPFDLETNASMLTVTLQFVNRPQAIDSIFKAVNMEGMDLENCSWCENRFYIMGLTDIEMQRFDQAIALLTPFAKHSDHFSLKQVLLKAYIKSGDYAGADALLADLKLISPKKEWWDLTRIAAKDFLIKGENTRAYAYFDKLKAGIMASKDSIGINEKKLLAQSLFFTDEFGAAEKALQEVLRLDPGAISYHALLAMAYQKNKKTGDAERQLKELENLRGAYQFGSVDYALAQYYAFISDEEHSLNYLLQAVALGSWYASDSFQNDPFFKDYLDTAPFRRVMEFWR